MTRFCALVAVGLACAACAADHDKPGNQAAAAGTPAGCIASGGGFLHAQLRGALVADLNWSNAEMQCAGAPRPDGQGLRLTFAGPLPDTESRHPGAAGDHPAAVGNRPGAVGATRQLRFIFGIDAHDTAAGAVQALPTNLTVIVEGEQQLYATQGATHCAVETLERSPLNTGSKQNRVHARGYCLGPATNVAGDARLLVPTFEFTGVADTEAAP